MFPTRDLKHSLIRQVLFTLPPLAFSPREAGTIYDWLRMFWTCTLVHMYSLDEVLFSIASRLKASLAGIGLELVLCPGCVSLGGQVIFPQWYKNSLQEIGSLSLSLFQTILFYICQSFSTCFNCLENLLWSRWIGIQAVRTFVNKKKPKPVFKYEHEI